MILYRYILREFLISFLFMAAILTAIMYGLFAVTTAQQSRDLGFEFVLMNSWPLFVQVLPYTILAGLVIGATIAYGRLASDNEIDAIRVTGIYARRVLRPAALLGLAMSAASFYLHADAVPRAYDQQRLNKREITVWLLKHPPMGPKDLGLYGMKFSYAEARDGKFRQLTLIKLDPSSLSPKTQVFAPEATIDFSSDSPVVHMPSATVTDFENGRKLTEMRVSDFKVPLETDPYKNYNPRPRYRDWEQLGEALIGGFPPETIWKEAIMRISKGFLPVPLAIIGAALGVLVRRSSKMAGLGLSVPPLAVTLILVTISEGLSGGGLVIGAAVALAPLALACAAAGVIFYRIKV
jgi:lipopolysaccharide export system permease protein